MPSRNQMIEALGFIQNRASNHNRDILTFAGLLDNEELAAYVDGHFRALKPGDKIAVAPLVFAALSRVEG